MGFGPGNVRRRIERPGQDFLVRGGCGVFELCWLSEIGFFRGISQNHPQLRLDRLPFPVFFDSFAPGLEHIFRGYGILVQPVPLLDQFPENRRDERLNLIHFFLGYG